MRLVLLFMLIAISAAGATPTQFKTVVEAVESAGDYAVAEGSLVVVSSSPLHVMVKPPAVKGDFPKVLEEISKREIVWVALLAFAHTSVNELTITSFPDEIDYRSNAKRALTAYKRTAAVTRDQFNSLVKKHLKLATAADLIGDQKIGTETFPDMPLDASNRILYNDQGPPGLDRFFAELVR